MIATIMLSADICAAINSQGEGSLMPQTIWQHVEAFDRIERLSHSLSLSLRHRIGNAPAVQSDVLNQLHKGQQGVSLPLQAYAHDGRPQPTMPASLGLKDVTTQWAASKNHTHTVSDGAALQQAVRKAQAGDTILLAPGVYILRNGLSPSQAGQADAPITVRAQSPGEVKIRIEGGAIHQARAYWIYENLTIEGHCGKANHPCEHAFHVVGAARHVVIRNNHIRNFSAHIKVNGEKGLFPDAGLLQFNTLSNDTAIATNMLTPFDLVGASHWVVADNQVTHFIKANSAYPSYGIFMKGGGEGGLIERNLVMCATNGNANHGGSRVGISLGGGLTGPQFCRDGRCQFEHKGGIIRNNVIVDCNDVGIDNNRAMQSLIANNTVIRTLGIGLRGGPSDATVYGNIVDGPVQSRQGSSITQDHNQHDNVHQFPTGWRNPPARIPSHHLVSDDFCGRARTATTLPGAFHQAGGCRDLTPVQ